MKEAIKVQSVTIIIINGISESFQSVRWVIRKTEGSLHQESAFCGGETG